MNTINRIYNTSNWSVKGISGELMMKRDTILEPSTSFSTTDFSPLVGDSAGALTGEIAGESADQKRLLLQPLIITH